MQILIEKGSDVNALNEIHLTPLHVVGSAESAQLLINHGADVTAQDWCYRTPLHIALSSYYVSAKTCHSRSSSRLIQSMTALSRPQLFKTTYTPQ